MKFCAIDLTDGVTCECTTIAVVEEGGVGVDPSMAVDSAGAGTSGWLGRADAFGTKGLVVWRKDSSGGNPAVGDGSLDETTSSLTLC